MTKQPSRGDAQDEPAQSYGAVYRDWIANLRKVAYRKKDTPERREARCALAILTANGMLAPGR